jgi:hypothetical protein
MEPEYALENPEWYVKHEQDGKGGWWAEDDLRGCVSHRSQIKRRTHELLVRREERQEQGDRTANDGTSLRKNPESRMDCGDDPDMVVPTAMTLSTNSQVLTTTQVGK